MQPTATTHTRGGLDRRQFLTLDEFPGAPDTGGEVFTVNCPVPVLAPPTYEPPT